jgi:hypothetical protein
MQIDPRTFARNIPGVFNQIFPQLTPGVVMHFNMQAEQVAIQPLTIAMLDSSKLQHAVLFELAYSVAENLLHSEEINWESCFQSALKRQQVYLGTNLAQKITKLDADIAEIVGRNLKNALREMSRISNKDLVQRPNIPGLEWIASGCGDFAIGDCLVEVKSICKPFSSSDYRQVIIYWLLSYAAAIEGYGREWKEFVLFNPRSGAKVRLSFDKLLATISSGRTKVEILQIFRSLVGSRLI